MARPSIEPITESTLPEFARFLHLHLKADRSAADWEAGLRTQWLPEAGNFGFVVREEGEIVGGIGAFYSLRQIRGQPERFCNITSWCVLEAYRQQSMRLAMALLSQKGYHFTNFSPTKVVGSTLKFLKFKELDERVAVMLNWPSLGWAGISVLTSPEAIEDALQGEDLKGFRDHAQFPWLRQVVFGKPGQWCHVIYKRRSFKGLASAHILHVSDRTAFASGFRRLAAHFVRQGIATTQVELRYIGAAPWPSAIRLGFNPKLYLSPSLSDDDIDCLYSESMALDL